MPRQPPPQRNTWPQNISIAEIERPLWSRLCWVCVFLSLAFLSLGFLTERVKRLRSKVSNYLFVLSYLTTVVSSSLVWCHLFFNIKVMPLSLRLFYQETGPRAMHYLSSVLVCTFSTGWHSRLLSLFSNLNPSVLTYLANMLLNI